MSNQEEENEEELFVLKLEEEVETMAQITAKYKTTINSTLSSILASQIPFLPTHQSPQPDDDVTRPEEAAGPTKGIVGSAESETLPLAITREPEELKKIQLLKEKMASNASTLPVVVKRMKEFMAKIDKLETSNVVIHPAFKRKRTD